MSPIAAWYLSRRRLITAGLFTLTMLACTESRVFSPSAAAPAPIESRLVLAASDLTPSTGSDVLITMQALTGDRSGRVVGSFTAQLDFDENALAFINEVPELDGATRVVNPHASSVRMAGISSTGFANGRLAQLRFRIVQVDGLRSIRLVVDELHDVGHADLRTALGDGRIPLVDAKSLPQ